MTKPYLYRRGNGNEGNYTRYIIHTAHPYEALKACVVNDYIASSNRRYIMKNIETDGEAEYSIYATICEGPNGETEFGAAWITAELAPLDEEDYAYYKERLDEYTEKEAFVRPALAYFNKLKGQS